jgi:hypothetical protein
MFRSLVEAYGYPFRIRRRDHRAKAIRSDVSRLTPILAYCDGGLVGITGFGSPLGDVVVGAARVLVCRRR